MMGPPLWVIQTFQGFQSACGLPPGADMATAETGRLLQATSGLRPQATSSKSASLNVLLFKTGHRGNRPASPLWARSGNRPLGLSRSVPGSFQRVTHNLLLIARHLCRAKLVSQLVDFAGEAERQLVAIVD